MDIFHSMDDQLLSPSYLELRAQNYSRLDARFPFAQLFWLQLLFTQHCIVLVLASDTGTVRSSASAFARANSPDQRSSVRLAWLMYEYCGE